MSKIIHFCRVMNQTIIDIHYILYLSQHVYPKATRNTDNLTQFSHIVLFTNMYFYKKTTNRGKSV